MYRRRRPGGSWRLSCSCWRRSTSACTRRCTAYSSSSLSLAASGTAHCTITDGLPRWESAGCALRKALQRLTFGSPLPLGSALRALPAGGSIERRIVRGQHAPAENVIGRFLGQHDGGRIQIAGGDRGHDGRVDDTQPLESLDARLRVDDRPRVAGRAHLASARGVIRTLHLRPHEGVDLLVGLNLGTGLELAAPVAIERRLRKDLPREAHAGAHLGPVIGLAQVVELDLRL